MGFRVVRPGAKASEHGRFGTISPHPELELPPFSWRADDQALRPHPRYHLARRN
jgi:hypothetical protein